MHDMNNIFINHDYFWLAGLYFLNAKHTKKQQQQNNGGKQKSIYFMKLYLPAIKELHFADSLAVTDMATLRFLLLITRSPHPQQTTQTVISIHEFLF